MRKTYQFLRECYYWLRKQQDVEFFFMTCLVCKEAKRYRAFTFWKSKLNRTTKLFDQINIDHSGSLALPSKVFN